MDAPRFEALVRRLEAKARELLGFRAAGFLTLRPKKRADAVLAILVRVLDSFPEEVIMHNLDGNAAALAANFKRVRGSRLV